MFHYFSAPLAESADPITALLTRDWAAFGGWSLFIGLGLFLIIAFFRETIVPGARYRRLEDAALKTSEANNGLIEQNGQLIQANQITEHFFRETVPKRGEPKT
jgi:hypothetical protein